MTDDRLHEIIAHHCGRVEDETLLASVREAARAIADEAAEEERDSILDSVENDMPLSRAEHLARLWAAGKLIGGDAHGVCIALLGELDRLRGA